MNRSKFLVKELKEENKNIVTIALSPAGVRKNFKAGQYVAVYLHANKPAPAKFYSISSSPKERNISISVKKAGVFSSALHDLKKGNQVFLSGPFGSLYPRKNTNNLVFLASGIGIAPFVSIVKDYNDKGNKKTKRRINVFYTCKNLEDLVFSEDLNKIAERNDFLKIHYFLTKEKRKNDMISKYGRIDARYMKRKLGGLEEKDFYICGSTDFVEDMRKQLIKNKVAEKNIFTETFF